MAKQPIVNIAMYIISVAIIALLVVGASWGFWVMFVAWNISAARDWAPIVITATSVFWVCVGGLLWLVPSRRPKN